MKNKNLGMFFSVIIASLLVLGTPVVLGASVSGNVNVGSGNITIDSYTVNNNNPVDLITNPRPNITFTITDTNGWQDINTISQHVLQNRSNSLVANSIMEILGHSFNANGEWGDLEYSAISNPRRSMLDKSSWTKAGNQDVYFECPTGNCTEKISVSTVGSDSDAQVKYIDFTDPENDSGVVNSIRTLNLTADGGSWTNEVNLTGGTDYFGDLFPNQKQILNSGAVVGIKDNQSNYAVILLGAKGDTQATGMALVSDRPYMNERQSSGYSTSIPWIAGNGNTMNFRTGTPELSFEYANETVNATTIKFTTLENPRPGFPTWWSPDSEVNQQLLQVYVEGSGAGSAQTEIDWTGSPGVLAHKNLQLASFEEGYLNFSASPGKTGSDHIYLDGSTNVLFDLNISGNDFGGPTTFGVNNSQATFRYLSFTPCGVNETLTVQNSEQMYSHSIKPMDEYYCDTGSPNLYTYHFRRFDFSLNVPLGTPSGTYTNTYTFTAI